MARIPLIIRKVHQADFVHNKIHLGTSALTQHYLLVMKGECFPFLIFQYSYYLAIELFKFFFPILISSLHKDCNP